LEWWKEESRELLDGPPPEGTDAPGIFAALRVGFTGHYDSEEDDFTGTTYFLSPELEGGGHDQFRTSDKRKCGFLFLRTLRTGSRALSLERGSLLDIILRLQDKQLNMWEEVLTQLRTIPVAEQEELGIKGILSSIQDAVRSYVPSDWADNPHMRVSDLTRESLRKSLTIFMSTGAKLEDGKNHAAPYQHQGTGTINTLVLALLSIIADLKQNVIFAMEEPEIAIPPHTQKRIINSVCSKSAQAIFTSHSPYVLAEFEPGQVLALKRENGVLSGTPASYPPTVKPKAYQTEFRSRFCEALLARRVLICEGRTEFDAIPAVARRLSELHPTQHKTLESLGIAWINAQSDSQVAPLGDYYKGLGKVTFAVFDQQAPTQKALIVAAIPVANCFEAPAKGIEKMIVDTTAESGLRRYGLTLVTTGDWPSHLSVQTPTETMSATDLKAALMGYFKWAKGEGGVAELLGQCSKAEMPSFIVNSLEAIQRIVEPPPPAPVPAGPPAAPDGAALTVAAPVATENPAPDTAGTAEGNNGGGAYHRSRDTQSSVDFAATASAVERPSRWPWRRGHRSAIRPEVCLRRPRSHRPLA